MKAGLPFILSQVEPKSKWILSDVAFGRKSRVWQLRGKTCKLASIILRTVGIDGGIALFGADEDEVSHVAISAHARRKMCDRIVQISNDEKMRPAECDLLRQTTVQDARTAKSVATNLFTQIGAVIPYVFMAQNGKRGTVTVSYGTNAVYFQIFNQGL